MSDETNNTELQPVNTQVVPVESSSSEDVSPKSRLCALLLGIFLGHLGIHNFYLGRIGRGLAQCLLRVFGFIFYMVGLFALFLQMSIPIHSTTTVCQQQVLFLQHF